MDGNIRASIKDALDSRRAQREPIARLHGSWQALAQSVETLAGTLGETGQRFAGLRQPTAEQAAVAEAIVAESDAAEITELRQAITGLTPDITAIRNRIDRDTVNIGVIGRAKAGKSTLLRTITNLGEETIPSTELNPTTAARSRILHSPGRADAEITVLSWDEFRDGYLAPLHADAGCEGPVPRTPDEFAGHKYEDLTARGEAQDQGLMGQQKFLERLHDAQDSFASYRGLLTGPGRTLKIADLAELRPYVAYPMDPADQRRPYHAVRDVRIYCAFPRVDVENLMLVDLPGAGEAGLDIDRQFLQDLKNEVDVLLQVKRPGPNDAFFGDQDYDVLDLADEARMGVNKGDFVAIVVNTDPAHLDPAYVRNAIEQTLKITERNELRLLVGDVADPAEVQDQILAPVLRGLADRLAAMDHAAAGSVLIRAGEVARRAITLSGRLARQAGRWASHVPDEDQALDAKAKEVRNDVARTLDSLRGEYAQWVAGEKVVEELDLGISRARQALIEWAEDGFGHGGKDRWLAIIEPSMVADPGETRDDQCTLVRQKIREEFSRVDGSIAATIGKLQLRVAGDLREHLGSTLVPAGDQPLAELVERTRQQRLETLHAALEELVRFHTYGNIFLRVGRPVVGQIYPARTRITVEGDPPGGAGPLGSGALGSGALGSGPLTAGDLGLGAEVSGPRKGGRAGSLAERMRNISGVVSGVPAVDAALAVTEVVATVAPAIIEMIGQTRLADDTAEGLYQTLTEAFANAVAQIEALMRAEACGLTEVLASVTDQFFDRIAHTPGIEDEFKRLCGPVRRELWRDVFDGRAAELVAALDQVTAASARTGEAGRQIGTVVASLGIQGN